MTTTSSLTLETLIDRLFTELSAIEHTPDLAPPEGIMMFDYRKYYDYAQN